MKPLEEWSRLLAEAADPVLLPFAILCGLVLAGVAVSFFALARAKGVARTAALESKAEGERYTAALASLREALDGLEAQVGEIRRQAAAVPAAPKPGFNLGNRTQALRRHRRGEAPGAIAAALDIPLQEVDLLLKVHRIVISNL